MLYDDHASMPRSEGRLDAPPRYALVYTTSAWNPFIESMYQRNATRVGSGAVHIVADESEGPVDIPRTYAKCIATQDAVAALGLPIEYKNALFRDNTDYLAYLFFFRHPGYDYYVFLDGDAYVTTSVDQLVADIARRGVDYVGTPVEPGFAAVTVLSRPALAYLFMRRRQMSASTTFGHGMSGPGGAAFVSSELKLGGFALAPLDDFGALGSFAWWPPERDEVAGAPAKLGRARTTGGPPRFMQSMLRHSTTREGVRPNAQLWRAIRSCQGWRWAMPLASEFAWRLSHLAQVSRSGGRARPLASPLASPPASPLATSPSHPAAGLRIAHAGRAATTCNRNGRYGIGKATRG